MGFRSYDLIVNRNIADDRRRVCDLIDTDFSHWEIFLLYFGMDANIFSRYHVHLGEPLIFLPLMIPILQYRV